MGSLTTSDLTTKLTAVYDAIDGLVGGAEMVMIGPKQYRKANLTQMMKLAEWYEGRLAKLGGNNANFARFTQVT